MQPSPVEQVINESDSFDSEMPEKPLPEAFKPTAALSDTQTAPPKQVGVAEIIVAIAWLLFIPYLLLIFSGLTAALGSANGAPQEAAAAAMAAAYTIIPYCGIRALTSALRSLKGK